MIVYCLLCIFPQSWICPSQEDAVTNYYILLAFYIHNSFVAQADLERMQRVTDAVQLSDLSVVVAGIDLHCVSISTQT